MRHRLLQSAYWTYIAELRIALTSLLDLLLMNAEGLERPCCTLLRVSWTPLLDIATCFMDTPVALATCFMDTNCCFREHQLYLSCGRYVMGSTV